MKLPNELVTDMKLMSSILDRSTSTCFILLGSKIPKDEARSTSTTGATTPSPERINEDQKNDKITANLSNFLARIKISDIDPADSAKNDDLISRSPARSSLSFKKSSRQNIQPYPVTDLDTHLEREKMCINSIKSVECMLPPNALSQVQHSSIPLNIPVSIVDACDLPFSVLEHLEDNNSQCSVISLKTCDVLQEPEFIEQFKKHVEDLQSAESCDSAEASNYDLPMNKTERKHYINLSASKSSTKLGGAVAENYSLSSTLLPQTKPYRFNSLNIPNSISDGEECNSADTWGLPSSVANKVSSSPSSYCSTLSTSPSQHSAAYPSPSWCSTADPSPSPCDPISSSPLNFLSSFTTSTSSYLECNSPAMHSPHSSSSSPPSSILSPKSILPQINSVHTEHANNFNSANYINNKVYACNSVPTSETPNYYACFNSTDYVSEDSNDLLHSEPNRTYQNFYMDHKNNIPSPVSLNLPLNIIGSSTGPATGSSNAPLVSFNKPSEKTFLRKDQPTRTSPVLMELPVKNSSKYSFNNNLNIKNNNPSSANSNYSDNSVPNLKSMKKKINPTEPSFLEIQPDGLVVRDEEMVISGKTRIEKQLHKILQIAAIAETFSKNPSTIFSDLIELLSTFESKKERGKLEKIYACVERLKKKDLLHLLDERDSNGLSILYYAALKCHKFPVLPRYIADSIVDVNLNPDQLFTSEQNSLLHITAGLGGTYTNVLAELLNVRTVANEPIFKINRKNSSLGYAPLHSAVVAHCPPQQNRITAVKILVKYGANLDAQDNHGRRPLHHAIMGSGDPVLIKILLQKSSVDTDASVNSVDLNGDSPLHLAAGRNDLPLSVQRDIIKQLTDKGAVSKLNLLGNLPVHFLSFDRKQEFQVLLQRKK